MSKRPRFLPKLNVYLLDYRKRNIKETLCEDICPYEEYVIIDNGDGTFLIKKAEEKRNEERKDIEIATFCYNEFNMVSVTVNYTYKKTLYRRTPNDFSELNTWVKLASNQFIAGETEFKISLTSENKAKIEYFSLEESGKEGETFQKVDEEFVISRSFIREFHDQSLSSNHATIKKENDVFCIRDNCNTGFGTYVPLEKRTESVGIDRFSGLKVSDKCLIAFFSELRVSLIKPDIENILKYSFYEATSKDLANIKLDYTKENDLYKWNLDEIFSEQREELKSIYENSKDFAEAIAAEIPTNPILNVEIKGSVLEFEIKNEFLSANINQIYYYSEKFAKIIPGSTLPSKVYVYADTSDEDICLACESVCRSYSYIFKSESDILTLLSADSKVEIPYSKKCLKSPEELDNSLDIDPKLISAMYVADKEIGNSFLYIVLGKSKEMDLKKALEYAESKGWNRAKVIPIYYDDDNPERISKEDFVPLELPEGYDENSCYNIARKLCFIGIKRETVKNFINSNEETSLKKLISIYQKIKSETLGIFELDDYKGIEKYRKVKNLVGSKGLTIDGKEERKLAFLLSKVAQVIYELDFQGCYHLLFQIKDQYNICSGNWKKKEKCVFLLAIIRAFYTLLDIIAKVPTFPTSEIPKELSDRMKQYFP